MRIALVPIFGGASLAGYILFRQSAFRVVFSLTSNSAIAALTLNMPVNPRDGQMVTVHSVSVVTALTMSGTPGGDTLVGALTALTAGGFGSWTYEKSASIWRRIG